MSQYEIDDICKAKNLTSSSSIAQHPHGNVLEFPRP